MTVSEPEPGRVLAETDTATGLVTTFTLTPEDSGRQTRVRIATDWTTQPGVAGLIEKWTTPPVMQRIYHTQLRQLAAFLQDKRAAVSKPA